MPAIAAASIAPVAAAASNVPVLAFDKTTYTGTACSTITGTYLTATVGGVPTAGISVTVALSGSYTFTGGSTSYTGVTDSAGKVSLPAITVPATGGAATASATAASATTVTASVTAPVPSTGGAYFYDWYSGSNSKLANVPAGSTPVGQEAFLTNNGDLWVSNVRVATGVSAAVAQPYFDPNGGNVWHNYVTYVSSSGAYFYDGNGGGNSKQSNVPAGSKPVGQITFLAPNGDLYLNNSRLASNVTSAVAQPYYDYNWHTLISYTTASGAYVYDWYNGSTGTQTNVPGGSTAVGYASFLAQNGDLYVGNKKVASGVTAAVAQPYFDPNGGNVWHNYVAYTTSAGAFTYDGNGGGGGKQTNVPVGSTPVGQWSFLAPNGDLYLNNSKLTSNVTGAVVQPYYDYHWHTYITYSTVVPC
ncbi:hypothetical protein AVW09_14995 [Microbacterium sp. T32]|nr:hypothetical protein AVW09_14995 [Microbacterium sp. T32]